MFLPRVGNNQLTGLDGSCFAMAGRAGDTIEEC